MIKLVFLLLSISYVYRANGFKIQGTQKTVTDTKYNLWPFVQLSYTHNQEFN